MKYLQRSILFLVYSNLFIAACAVLMAQQTCWLLAKTGINGDLIKFIFFSTVCSYGFHYYFTTHSQLPSPRVQWIQKNKPTLVLLFLAGLAGSVFFFFRLREYQSWLLPAVVATFLYSAPKIPHPLFAWLKKVAIGKTIFLAFIWMYVTVVLPLVVAEATWSTGFTIYAASRYFFIYSICILFDYRDRDDDKINGVKSLITFLDRKNITRLFLFSLLASFVLTLLLKNHGIYWTDILFLLMPGMILAGLYKLAMRNFSDILYYVVLDGLMALSAIPMLVARI